MHLLEIIIAEEIKKTFRYLIFYACQKKNYFYLTL